MSGNNNGQRDHTFLVILCIFGGLMCLFGVLAICLTLWGHPSDKVIYRLINAMGGMFAGMLGLAIGYLTGRK